MGRVDPLLWGGRRQVVVTMMIAMPEQCQSWTYQINELHDPADFRQ